MLAKRIIACLDVSDGVVVKGVQFKNHQIMGNIIPLAQRYADDGIDELVFYDITAATKNTLVNRNWIEKVAKVINIPFCVAGGIKSVEDAKNILSSGADKISINSSALINPNLITKISERFGVQCMVVGIDSWFDEEKKCYMVQQYTGDVNKTYQTNWKTFEWIKKVQEKGAGEIVLNMMNQDGLQKGYDLIQLSQIRDICKVPLIASGGAGKIKHFYDAFYKSNVDGVLAASVFHKNLVNIKKIKRFFNSKRNGDQNVLTSQDLLNLNWLKTDGMIPVIIQNFFSNKILMHGYMNKEALLKTQKNGLVTFYSRTKKRLWTKGEESGNYLKVIEITTDCDYDTLLILVEPLGKTCHLGNSSCFLLKKSNMTFLVELENIIKKRKKIYKNNSYTSELYKSGTSRIAQKVGEEAIETILAVMKKEKLEIINESSDLLYHFIVLLHDQNLNLNIILDNLQKRNIKKLSTDSQLI